jgi:hypothetical protein
VAEVVEGRVTGRAVGAVWIRAGAGRAADSVRLTVERPVRFLNVSPTSAALGVGASIRIFTQLSDSTSFHVDHSLSWSSSDPSVVTVTDSGTVVGVGTGAATVRARAGAVTQEIPITVEKPYALTVLYAGADRLRPQRVNSAGEAVWTVSRGLASEAFVWRDGGDRSLGAGRAWDINDRGEIAGCLGADAVIWRNGLPAVLYRKPFYSSCATAINERGDVAGYATDPRFSFTYTSFILRGDSVEELAGGFQMEPREISESGWVVGTTFDRTRRPALWRDGALTRLPAPLSEWGQAEDISGDGTIVGVFRGAAIWSGDPLAQTTLPGTFDHCEPEELSRGEQSFPGPPGAYGANERGEIVGISYGWTCFRGVLWREGLPLTLQYLHTDRDWVIQAAYDINDRGQILAGAVHRVTKAIGVVLLTPSAPRP